VGASCATSFTMGARPIAAQALRFGPLETPATLGLNRGRAWPGMAPTAIALALPTVAENGLRSRLQAATPVNAHGPWG